MVETPAPQEPVRVEGELFFEWKYAVNATDLKGSTDRSFLHEGVNHLFDFSHFHKYPLAGGQELESTGVFRYTDDPRVDPERNSVQRAYLRWTGPTFELTGGDRLVNYSRFSFNQNIKGLHGRKDLDALGGLRLTGTAGFFTDRWGSLYRGFEKFTDFRTPPDPRFPSKPYTRLVLGVRGEKPLVDETKWVAVNYSQGSDIIRSLPRQAQVAPFNNQLWSVDWSFLFTHNLRLTGELAYSASQFDARFQDDKRGDYAARVELSQQWRRYRWRLEYNRFMPKFFSVNARQVQDLQDFSLQGTVDFSRHLSLTGTFRRTNDNLPGDPVVEFVPRQVCNDAAETLRPQPLSNANRTQTVCDPVTGDFVGLTTFGHVVDSEGREVTTVLRLPEVRLTLRSLPFWQRLIVDVGYRERVVETSNTSSFRLTTETSTSPPASVTFLTPLFQERATKIPFVDISLPFGIHQFRFGYEYRRNRDRALPENSTFTHRATAQYRLPSLFIGAWTVSGDLRFETERESKQVELETLKDPVTQLTVVDPLTLRPVVRRQSAGDQIRSIQGSLVLEFPKYFTLDLYYRELNAELLSSFQLGALPQFGNGGYRRPTGRAQLQYRIRDDENKYFLFTVERNVNTFNVLDPTQPDTRSFREKLAQITFVYRFHR